MADEELKRHFAVLTEHLDSKIALLAEGQAALRVEVMARIDLLEKTMQDEAQETRALIRLSYNQLDKRVSSLEADVSELKNRLSRVEASLNH
jgi:hypothetical protein